MDYTFFQMTRGDNGNGLEDTSRKQSSNIQFSNYLLDNPFTSNVQNDHVLLFSSQNYMIPKFSVNGISTDTSFSLPSDVQPKPTEFRFGSTTPFLANGNFFVDQQTKLLPTPSFNKKE